MMELLGTGAASTRRRLSERRMLADGDINNAYCLEMFQANNADEIQRCRDWAAGEAEKKKAARE